MFTKHKKVAQVDAYKKVTDWGAVFNFFAFWGVFIAIGIAIAAK